ncbi:MAG: DUF2922 domain-containing protein [Clostridiaceae bacterium]|nr:DUF2922 domain-containing protein [Clostridiaceae bacterium]
MRRVLQMTFKKTDDRLARINVNDSRLDLTPQDVKTAMENMIDQNIFKVGGAEFAAVEEAKVIVTQEEVLDLQ